MEANGRGCQRDSSHPRITDIKLSIIKEKRASLSPVPRDPSGKISDWSCLGYMLPPEPITRNHSALIGQPFRQAGLP